MGRVTARTRIVRLDDAGAHGREDQLAVEEPLELRLSGEGYTVTMRTPGHDVELAFGFLLAEGIIRDAGDVTRAAFCAPPGEANTYNVLDLSLRVPVTLERRTLTTSACGVCGRTSLEEVRTRSAYDVGADDLRVAQETLHALPDRLRDAQRVFDRTGGLHAAGLFTAGGELLVAREDVGRHNAVDKVVGWAMQERGLPLSGTVLMVSGRASFELVQKACVAGIPVLAAVSAPSSLAVDLAREAGLTLVGFLRPGGMNVYAGEQRITRQEAATAPAR